MLLAFFLLTLSFCTALDLSDHGKAPTPFTDPIDVFADTKSPRDINQNSEKIPYTYGQVDYFLNHIEDSPVHRYEDEKFGKPMDLSALTEFAGIVDPESLKNAVYATVGLLMTYEYLDDAGMLQQYQARGTGFYINLTHFATARHNVHGCVLFSEDGTSTPCDGIAEDKRPKNVYTLVDILMCRGEWSNSGDEIDEDSVTYPHYNESLKGYWSYYGEYKHVVGSNYHFVNDTAIIEAPIKPKRKRTKGKSKAKTQDFYTIDLESFDESKWFDIDGNLNKLLVVGFPPILREGETATLKDGKSLGADQFNLFFNGAAQGGAKPVFSISDVKTAFIRDEFVIHQSATWGGFSGSCIFVVADDGTLHPIAIHVGADPRYNWGILFIQSFLKQFVNDDCHIN